MSLKRVSLDITSLLINRNYLSLRVISNSFITILRVSYILLNDTEAFNNYN
jgi:hypothetical protein